MYKITVYSGLLVLGFIFFLPLGVSAEHTQLKQRILPANCIFDVVDVGGVQVFNYHTPEACGVDPNNPQPNPVPSETLILPDFQSGIIETPNVVVKEDNNNNAEVTTIDTGAKSLTHGGEAEKSGGIEAGKIIQFTVALVSFVGLSYGASILLMKRFPMLTDIDDK